MMSPIDCDVLIVGGGVVGMTLACALSQAHLQVIVVEATPATTPIAKTGIETFDLRTFALTRASERILTRLGVWQSLERLSPFREMFVWEANSPGEIHFDSAALCEPTLGYIVEHHVLQSALHTRLAELETCQCYRPAKLQHFELKPNHMQVQLAEGPMLTTRLLVGAEGAHSTVRTLAGIAYDLHNYGQQAIVATVDTVLSHRQTAWQRFLPTGPLAFLPLSAPHTSSIVWSLDIPEAQRLLALDKAPFHRALEKAFDFKLGAVNESSHRLAFPLQSRHVHHYVQPRLALVGDAAHTVHPLAGQGMNLGLLDAATLAEIVLEAQTKRRDWGDYGVLRRYERWRKGHNLAVLKLMTGFKQLFGTNRWPLRWARHWGLNGVNAAPPLKSLIMQQAMGLRGDLPPLAR